MKIKCDDKLPSKEGEYETDLGILTLMIHGRDIRIWYVKIIEEKNWSKVTSYKRIQPEWWIEK